MICPTCTSTEGHYSDIEDFNPGGGGSDPEWSYYECWTCYNCEHTLYSYENGYEYEDEE